MKKLLILPLFLFLSGCVTYYTPETALKDGIYYAEDDPSYVMPSGIYPGIAYYPWVSMDYFYMAYYPYYYQRYYSRWYISHYQYPGYPVRRYRNDYCSVYGCEKQYRRNRHGNRHDRYAGNNRSTRSLSTRSTKSVARGSTSRSASPSSGNKMSRASARESRD